MLETIKFWGEVGIGGVFVVLFLAWVVWPFVRNRWLTAGSGTDRA